MENHNLNGGITNVVKGIGIAITVSLVCVLIFSAIVKFCMLSSTVIRAVNQFFKIISVFLGCFFAVKQNKGLVKGIAVGLIYTLLIHLIFCLLSSHAYFTTTLLWDLVMAIVCGGVFGAIAVNKSKE